MKKSCYPVFNVSERQNLTLKEELENVVKLLKDEDHKSPSSHLVRLSSSIVVGNEDTIASAHDGQTLTLWHDLSNETPLEGLQVNWQEKENKEDGVNPEDTFR